MVQQTVTAFMFVFTDVVQSNFAPKTAKLLKQYRCKWGTSFNKKNKSTSESQSSEQVPSYFISPLLNVGEEAERHWDLDEHELEQHLRLIWREKLGIEGVPVRFAVFPSNGRAISHCSLRTTSPMWHARAASRPCLISHLDTGVMLQKKKANKKNSWSEAKVFFFF